MCLYGTKRELVHQNTIFYYQFLSSLNAIGTYSFQVNVIPCNSYSKESKDYVYAFLFSDNLSQIAVSNTRRVQE